jgi:hypothetical protein
VSKPITHIQIGSIGRSRSPKYGRIFVSGRKEDLICLTEIIGAPEWIARLFLRG